MRGLQPHLHVIEPAESPLNDDEYPFVLTSGRVPYFHHGTMRHAAFSRELFPTAEIRINPASAKELGIEHMDWGEGHEPPRFGSRTRVPDRRP